MPRNGTYKRRGERYYRAGQKAALDSLEPIIRSVIEAMGQFATATTVASIQNRYLIEGLRNGHGLAEPPNKNGRGVTRDAWVHKTMQDAAGALERQAGDIAGLRATNAKLCDLVEVLRAMAANKIDREALAERIIEEAKAVEEQAA